MLQSILKFVELTNKIRHILRATLVRGEERQENVLEHSCQLALVCWYFINKYGLPYDESLCIKYALIHDFVEIYAGDTPAYLKFKEKGYVDDQEIREAHARTRLQKEWPEFSELHQLIAMYEIGVDEESRFVHGLDKILPTCNTYLDGGRSWDIHGLDLPTIEKMKKEHMENTTPEVQRIYEDLMIELKKSPQLFNSV